MLLAATAAAVASTTLSAHLLVVCLVLRQDLLPHFLLSLMDIRIELIAVLLYGELLIVVNRNEDFLSAIRLLLWVVELSNIRMS